MRSVDIVVEDERSWPTFSKTHELVKRFKAILKVG